MHPLNHMLRVVTGALLLPALSLNAAAWTPNPSTEITPATCKLEPESQCTQAVFVDLQAPGLDINHASLPQARFDRGIAGE